MALAHRAGLPFNGRIDHFPSVQVTMPFKTSRVVLYGDCDPAGFIYTPRVAHYVVEAALDFLSYALDGPAARRILSMGILPPARALSIEFLYPLAWDQQIDIEVSVKKIGNHSFTLLLIARAPQNVEAFRATITQVCISPDTKRPALLPKELQTALLRTQGGQLF